ncbi:MAG: acetate--CoA ligase family protein [Planctomycetes bacterium]|nr:acetate--CoA ligase family protein [Planctomycetota bacterium]
MSATPLPPRPTGLDALFRPRAVAVVGASRNPLSVGHLALKKLLNGGFRGAVIPVNPNARSIASVAAVASIEALPDDVDLVVIAVPADKVEPIVASCAKKGIGGVIVLSAGFAEASAEGKAREARLRDLVRAHSMRMVGPNCLGLLNSDPDVSLDATFAPVRPLAGRVAMASQSGALGVAILETARELDLGLSAFVSVGNKADVSGNDLLEHWEDDPRTDLILLYLESFGNPRRFATIARRVARKKPILAVKAGRTAAGRRAAGSHTAALAAPERCVEALLRHTGVTRVATLEEMFDAATLLAHQPLPRGHRVAILTNAGGPGILCADACESQGLLLPELLPATHRALEAALPQAASLANPVDLAAPATADDYRRALPLLLEDPHVDAVIALFVSAGVIDVESVAAAIKEGRRASHGGRTKPLLTCFLGQRGIPAALSSDAESVPSYRFPESAARALACAVRRAEWLAQPVGVVPALPDVEAKTGHAIVRNALAHRGPGWLTPCEQENLLAAFGIPHLRSTLCRSADEAVAAAAALEGPAVVKLASTTIVHKSDWNGVHLNCRGADAVSRACAAIEARLVAAGRREELLGYTVAPMAPSGVDTLVGLFVDPSFGPLLAFGLGGVTTELMNDTAFRLVPLTDAEAQRMVGSIKGVELLRGFRGAPLADEPALVDLLLRVARLASELPEVLEVDLNPVRVFERGRGACALDARIRVGLPETKPLSPAG